MTTLKEEINELREYSKHHRIALYGVLFLLVLLTAAVIMTVKILFPSPLNSPSTNVQIPTQNSSVSITPTVPPLVTPTSSVKVSLQNSYQNPFDKKTQYTNPFTQYKNPFDTAK